MKERLADVRTSKRENNPYRFQNLLGWASWKEEKLCVEVRANIVEHINDEAGILAIDGIYFKFRVIPFF